MKLTPWFPAEIKPVREGWYECRMCAMRHYWDGVCWRSIPYGLPYTDDNVVWRGLKPR